MKQILGVIILFFLLVGCNSKPIDKYEELYLVVDEMIRFNYYDVDIVLLELNQALYPQNDTLQRPGSIYYSKSMLQAWMNEDVLDSLDVAYFSFQMDSLEAYTLDPSRVNKPSLKFAAFKSWIEEYGVDSTYQILEDKFDGNSLLRISSPLLSKGGDKMILSIDYYCGRLCGSGVTYFLQKEGDEWGIVKTHHNWFN